jgi:hypothetical protein
MMDNTILESYSKAVESTLRLQQEMLRNWTNQWSPLSAQWPGRPSTESSNSASATPEGSWLDQLSAAQKKWGEAVTDLLHRHQETLEEQYRAGIRAIDDAFRVSEAKDPEDFRRLSEELWKRNIEVLQTAVASQMHDVQLVMQKLYEAALASAPAAEP